MISFYPQKCVKSEIWVVQLLIWEDFKWDRAEAVAAGATGAAERWFSSVVVLIVVLVGSGAGLQRRSLGQVDAAPAARALHSLLTIAFFVYHYREKLIPSS